MDKTSVLNYDISDGYVWVVCYKAQGFPVFLSVHTDRCNAFEAMIDFAECGKFSPDMNDYSVTYQKLNRWVINNEVVR
jgi:hypothetical protein